MNLAVVNEAVTGMNGVEHEFTEEEKNFVVQFENLLVALEMYRIEEEKAISHLSDILTAYGIDVSAEEIRSTKAEEIRTTIREKAEVR